MNASLDQEDWKQLEHELVTDFDRRIASIPVKLCAPFHEAARSLEAELIAYYRVAARLARGEEDLRRVASLWGSMTQICDTAARRLSNLVQAQPDCGTESYHDRILDLRNKCQRLHQMHS